MGKATVYQYMILDTKRVELRKARPGRDQPLVGGAAGQATQSSYLSLRRTRTA